MKDGFNFNRLLKKIGTDNGFEVAQTAPLAGGDINHVFKVTSSTGEVFAVKLNDPEKYPGMFEAEKAGLKELTKTQTFTIPKVIATGNLENTAFLLLEFIERSSEAQNFWSIFGNRLAELHKNSSKTFGFDTDNYIGILPQQNKYCTTAAEFYITQRLEPQLKIARQKGFRLGNVSSLFKTCSEIIPDEASSLVHGDLWSGNYLTDAEGFPCLIDPAVAFAPREMDLAMMKLFGGFSPDVYESYNNTFPLQEDWEERIKLWQLYYLLVHLNIFGKSYIGRVTAIMNSYS